MSSKPPDPMVMEEVALCAAMRRRATELKGSVAALADPRPWIKDRPLTTCLIAAGAGMAIGMFAAGRKSSTPDQAATNGNADQAAHRKQHQTIGAMLAASLVPTLQPLISDLIHSAIGGLPTETDNTADVTEESMPSGLAEDNKFVDYSTAPNQRRHDVDL